MKKLKVLILSFSDLSKDPRVQRHIDFFLARGWNVTACGLKAPPQKNLTFIQIDGHRPRSMGDKIKTALLLKTTLFSTYYWSLTYIIEAKYKITESYDLILGNDAITMPLIHTIKGNAKTWVDLHEYAPEEFSDRFSWRFIFQPFAKWLCREFMKGFDRTITVCEPIAQTYANEFNVLKPFVLENRAKFRDLTPLRVDGCNVRMIHHGAALRSRQIENMIEIASHLGSGFELDLMLTPGDAGYLETIQALVNGCRNVRLINPVATHEIINFCNQYDIGLYLLSPSNFNNLNALPNKFFEFIQSRLAVMIGPSPAMQAYIKKYENGWVAPDFTVDSFVQILSKLKPAEIQSAKLASASAARELSFESSQQDLGSCLQKLFPQSSQEAL